jgi:2-amino-4-hydroxy-6-hydroxymethyldihydropteridine diphosphokinase
MNERAYLGMGSNIGNRKAYLRAALVALKKSDGIYLLQVSSLYETAPVGKVDQPSFLNAVAAIDTALSAEGLLHVLQDIEDAHQRQHTLHWGPRTLDLDILLYGDRIVSTPNLQLPHPYLTERSFVLVPLGELAPDLVHPQTKRLLISYPAATTDVAAIHRLGPLMLGDMQHRSWEQL